MKKPIVISSLAMRFHEKYGWTEELLKSYSGPNATFIRNGGVFGEFDPVYWIQDLGTKLDIDRLIADGHVGELVGRDQWGELNGLTDLEVLKNRNW